MCCLWGCWARKHCPGGSEVALCCGRSAAPICDLWFLLHRCCCPLCISQESERNIFVNLLQIRHIAITNCLFRFAFSHLPRYGKLLRQKHRNNFTWNLCASFSSIFRFQQAKPIRVLIYELAWLAGIGKSKENLLKTAPVTKVARIFWWRYDNRKQSASACERWCDVSCDISYCLITKGPTSYLLADFFIMTSQSNGPSKSCAIVTSQ